MKKLLALALIGLFATAANAGVFYINEASATPAPLVVGVSETASMGLYYQLWAGETMRGAQVFFTQASHNPGYEVVDAIFHAPFDTVDRQIGGMDLLPAAPGAGIPLAQNAATLNGYVHSSYDVAGTHIVAGPATVYLDEIILHGLVNLTENNVSIWNPAGPNPDLDGRSEFINGTNGAIGVVQPWPFGEVPFPGFTRLLNGSETAPYHVTVIPEPASLALLAIGGLALIRRR